MQLCINGRVNAGIKTLNPKAFIDYSQTVDNVYESFNPFNPFSPTLIHYDSGRICYKNDY